MSVHASCPPMQEQLLQPSPAGAVAPLGSSTPSYRQPGGTQPRSVQATMPSLQVHWLQPSLAGKLLPSVRIWPSYTQELPAQPRAVQLHPPPVQVQVLQPSPAGLLAPSAYVARPCRHCRSGLQSRPWQSVGSSVVPPQAMAPAAHSSAARVTHPAKNPAPLRRWSPTVIESSFAVPVISARSCNK